MRSSLYTILLFLVSQATNAQDWLVTTTADTLRGEIAIELPMERYEEITLKSADGKQRFKAYQVIEFVKDDQKYRTKKQAGVYKVMLVVSEGYLSQFRYRENQGYEFSSIYLVKTDGESMEVSNLTFKRSLSNFLEDCQTVVDGLENKKYKRSDLDKIIVDYNTCINEKSSFIISTEDQKKMPEVTNHQGIAIINGILKKTNDNADLNAILNDIKSKLSKGESIPGYLTSALMEQTADLKDIKEGVDQLLESIK